jgi:sporulation protein YlmC with PRC-barrel domain
MMFPTLARRAAALACGLSLLASTAVVLAAKPESDQGKKVQTNYTYRTSMLIGMQVKNLEGKDIGTLEDLVVDVRSGQVRYGVLSFGGILGIGDKLFPIPWRELSLRFQENESFLVADVSKSFLDKAPSFARDQWPDMNHDWIATLEALFPTHTGTLVAVGDERMTMDFGDGMGEHSHAIASNAAVTRDGAKANLADLKKGDKVKVTTEEQAGIRVVTRIDAHSSSRIR